MLHFLNKTKPSGSRSKNCRILNYKSQSTDSLVSIGFQRIRLVSMPPQENEANGMEDVGLRCHQVVLVPAPFQGHLTPMLQLGHILYGKGFSITVAHLQVNPPDPSHHPDFNFLEIPLDLSDMQTSTSLAALFGRILMLNVNCEPAFLSCLDELMKRQGPDSKISCIIYDEAMYFSGAAANHLRLPTIILRTSSVAAHFSRISLLQLNNEGRIPFPASNSEDLIPGDQALRYMDLPFTIETLEYYLRLVTETTKSRNSSAIILNTTSCLEEHLLKRLREESQIPIFAIGPLHKFTASSSPGILKDDSTCIEWLNKQARNSVLYVSMGSVVTMEEQELTEMAWGLANSKQAFLWVIRPGSVEASKWIESLPESFQESVRGRGHLMKWAPQKEVLAHEAVGGFLSHCGWNSTLESIYEGVPMICKPCFGDQKVNARYISHVWKAGLELKSKGNREEIERVITRLMASTEGEEIRQKASDLKRKMEFAISEGGSSYNSLNSLTGKLKTYDLKFNQHLN